MDNADRGANAPNDDLVEALKQRIRALADPPTSNEPAAELFRSEALGDLDRGRAPDLKSPHWRCRIIDPATGAVCARRPHHDNEHRGYHAVQGTGRSSRLTTWAGGTERAMVVDSFGVARGCAGAVPSSGADSGAGSGATDVGHGWLQP
jgi:hypothetical protein